MGYHILNYGGKGRGRQTGETEEGGTNSMKTLGNRTIDSKQAMDVWDALQDILTQCAKRASRAFGGSAYTNKFIGDRRRGDSAKRKNQGSNGR